MAPIPTMTFLSWNLAMLERPASAPIDWGQEHTQAEVRDVVLGLSPDIVLFQELPGVVPYVETHDMVRANPVSHSGNLATLVGNHLIDEENPQVSTVSGCGLLTTLFGCLTVANIHLAPGSGEAETRKEQMAAVKAAAPAEAIVIIGDSNTRLDEEPTFNALGLTSVRPPHPTWDSKRNRFRTTGPEFKAYFTRCWTAGDVTIRSQSVRSTPTTDVGDGPFHLSDHYGLVGTIVPGPTLSAGGDGSS